MQHADKTGLALAPGDEITIRGRVARTIDKPLAYGPTLEIEIVDPIPGTSLLTTVLLHSAQCSFARRPSDNPHHGHVDPPAPPVEAPRHDELHDDHADTAQPRD